MGWPLSVKAAHNRGSPAARPLAVECQSGDYPPVQTGFLVGDADPVRFAVHGRGQRRARQSRLVVLVAEVGGDQVLQPRGIQSRQQIGRLG